MEHGIRHLIALTRAMSAAFDRGDLELCGQLLDERGRILRKLAAAGGPDESRLEPPLREALAEARRLDRELGRRLQHGLAETGREISGLRRRRHSPAGVEKARRLDSRA